MIGGIDFSSEEMQARGQWRNHGFYLALPKKV